MPAELVLAASLVPLPKAATGSKVKSDSPAFSTSLEITFLHVLVAPSRMSSKSSSRKLVMWPLDISRDGQQAHIDCLLCGLQNGPDSAKTPLQDAFRCYLEAAGYVVSAWLSLEGQHRHPHLV